MIAAMLDIRVTELRIRRRILSGPMTIAVRSGNIHQLSGPNGCGKSLLLDATCGIGSARGVQVALDGRGLDGSGPGWRWRSGLRRLFQTPIIPNEVKLGDALAQSEPTNGDRLSAKCSELLTSIGLYPDSPIGRVSFGQRRVVELCVALLAPKAVLLDEPFAGLSEKLVVQARELLTSAADAGRAILVVDHSSTRRGDSYAQEHVWARPPEASRVDGADAPIHILKEVAQAWPRARQTRWSIGRIATPDAVVIGPATIALDPGTVVALTGSNGSGKSTVLRALAGLGQPWGQSSDDVERQPTSLFLSPQPPKLIAGLSVLDNLRCMLWEPAHHGRIGVRAACSLLRWLGFDFAVRGDWPAGEVSGGEAALVALIGAIVSDKMELLLDEPFEGLAPSIIPPVVSLLRGALDLGKSAIVATHPFADGSLAVPRCSNISLAPGTAAVGNYTGTPVAAGAVLT